MNIAVLGAGYVGLVSGACLAAAGHQVTCIDVSEARIAGLRRGEVPIFEAGLAELIAAGAGSGRLAFTTDAADTIGTASVVLIAVGTPPLADGRADTSQVIAAAEAIAPAATGPLVVAVKSTVPVGTGDAVETVLRRGRADLSVVSNPEFLREGKAVSDFQHPDRIVIGAEDARARAVMAELYRQAHGDDVPLVFTGRRTAELIKHAANAFLATKLSFINEMADLCEATGGNIDDLALGIGLDPRIGRQHLRAGPGYGGSCLPKDTQALAQVATDHGVRLRTVEATVAANAARKQAMGERVVAGLGGDITGRRIAVLGLSFTPGSDDVRESSSIDVLQHLLAAGAEVTAFDPEAMPSMQRLFPGVAYATSALAAAAGAEAIVVLTEWEAFRGLDLWQMREAMAGRMLFDFRNVYTRQAAEAAGLTYRGIGRGSDPVAAAGQA